MKINIKFKLEQRISIIQLNCSGRIKSIWIGDRGIRYEVRYFDNAKAFDIYFYEDELEELKNER